jgi:hypothetical protein
MASRPNRGDACRSGQSSRCRTVSACRTVKACQIAEGDIGEPHWAALSLIDMSEDCKCHGPAHIIVSSPSFRRLKKAVSIYMTDKQYAHLANLCGANPKEIKGVPIRFLDAPAQVRSSWSRKSVSRRFWTRSQWSVC